LNPVTIQPRFPALIEVTVMISGPPAFEKPGASKPPPSARLPRGQEATEDPSLRGGTSTLLDLTRIAFPDLAQYARETMSPACPPKLKASVATFRAPTRRELMRATDAALSPGANAGASKPFATTPVPGLQVATEDPSDCAGTGDVPDAWPAP
jgi:hypothetical protein